MAWPWPEAVRARWGGGAAGLVGRRPPSPPPRGGQLDRTRPPPFLQALQGFTPLAEQWGLGADVLVTATVGGSGHAALKGGSGGGAAAAAGPAAAAAEHAPPAFIPVPLPGRPPAVRTGGKVQPGSGGMGALEEGSPSLQLHPAAGGSACFAIHAFGRPLTQLDFISTGGGALGA